MRSYPRRAVQTSVLFAALLLTGLAWAVIHGLGDDRASLRHALEQRTRVSARLTADILSAGSDASSRQRVFDVPRGQLEAALRDYIAGDPTATSLVLDSRGRVLAAIPRGARVRSDAFRRALRGTHAVSDALPGGVFELATALHTRLGRIVLVDDVPLAQISAISSGYLRSATGVIGARGWLLDTHRRILAATTATRRPPPSERAGWTTTVVPVPGAPWHIVVQAPDAALYAPLAGARGTALALAIAFMVALLGLMAAGRLALRRSGQLAVAIANEEAASQLAHERLHDPLTALPNRALFLDRVERALASAERSGRTLAVLFVDLDRFKRVNDSLGHAAGDRLLVAVAQRLSEAVRPSDTVSRFGGDEFLILCEDLSDRSEAVLIGLRLQVALEEPLVLGERELHASCSIGLVAHSPFGGPTDAGALVRDADAAMYRAKARGRARLDVFDASLHEEAIRRLDTEEALRRAVGGGELRLVFQPIVALPDAEIRGAEALVRWERPGHGLVAPCDFVPLAEDTGLIGPIGAWVLAEAMRTAGQWRAAGLVTDEFSLSVNVSARQLTDVSFPSLVADALHDWALPPRSLCLEITETAVAQDPARAVEMLERLRRLGLRLAIDDFGVGHSSLERVARDLTIDVLKLDRSFVAGMDGERGYAVVATAASLARSLGVEAVAEGVEDAATASVIAAMGFPLAQGFHFAPPLDPDVFAEQLGSTAAWATSSC